VLTFGAAVLAVDRGLTAMGIEGGRATLGLVGWVVDWREQVHATAAATAAPVLVIVGDSLTMGSKKMTRANRLALPERVEQIMQQRPGQTGLRVFPLRWGGLGPTEVFFLADELVKSGADRVVLCLNLPSLSPHWAARLQYRSELATLISPRRLPTALALPLQRAGLSANQLLWYVALRNFGLMPVWRDASDLQARTTAARRLLEVARQRRKGLLQDAAALKLHRTTVAAAISGIPSDNPPLRFLTSAVKTLSAAGIDVTVFAMPLNLEYWRSFGVFQDDSGLRRTIDRVRDEVDAAGASFVDLHDFLAAPAFRDPAHFRFEQPHDGTQQVAEAMAAVLVEPRSR
jgi:hypothetical protein